jgi:hypothetical protein
MVSSRPRRTIAGSQCGWKNVRATLRVCRGVVKRLQCSCYASLAVSVTGVSARDYYRTGPLSRSENRGRRLEVRDGR